MLLHTEYDMEPHVSDSRAAKLTGFHCGGSQFPSDDAVIRGFDSLELVLVLGSP